MANDFNIEKYKKDGFQTLKEATQHSNALPSEGYYNYYMTNDSFSKCMKKEGEKILGMMNTIIKHYGVRENIRGRQFEDKDEVLIEGNDAILERASINIDEMNGIKRIPDEAVVIQTVTAQLPVGGSWNKAVKPKFSVDSSLKSSGNEAKENTIKLLTGHNILRPQKFFKDKIDNGNSRPWEPRIKEKPNNIGPLAIFLLDEGDSQEYSHPYQLELEKFKPHSDLLTPCEVDIPKPVTETPLHEISTVEELEKLVKELMKYKVIAVDLEHHSYRTFMGLTCLMQISTADADYIIDTLALRDKLYALNEVFTKPTILKVFHGADMDIKWLQRDLSLYVVNMFDTYRAAKLLGYSRLSLAYLMNKFCHFNPNKQFQLADWRIRPLPEELKSYAREDTHYLIYIYQMLRNELLEKGTGDNLLEATFNESTLICLQRYFKPRLTEESYLEFYRRGKRLFDNRQMFALKELYKWRDTIAREEDESTGYVLPNHMLFQISESLPKEMQGILACCSPVPPLVRANLLEIHQIILRAREQSLQKAIMKEDTRSGGTAQQVTKVNIESPLYCPHDLTRLHEFRDDLPTLLGTTNQNLLTTANTSLSIEKKKPLISVFDTPENSDDESKVSNKLKTLKFLGPFERYMLVKPFLQEEETKAKEEEENANKVVDKDAPVVDRIASLHEHFVKVLHDTPKVNNETEDAQQEDKDVVGPPPAKKKVPPRSLVEMGGRKRQRQNDDDEDESLPPEKLSKQENLQTPVPQFFNKCKYGKKKQGKSPNKLNPLHGQNQETPNQQHNQKQQPQRNKQSSNQTIDLTQSPTQNQQSPNKLSKNQRKKLNKRMANAAKNSSDTGANTSGHDIAQNHNRNKNKSNGNYYQHMAKQNFDYSQVDYTQFMGGARAVGPNTFNMSCRGKRKNKNKGGGKKNNLSSSFKELNKM